MNKVAWLTGAIVSTIVFSFDNDLGTIVSAVMIFVIGLIFYGNKTWAWLPAILITWTFIFFSRDMYSGYSTIPFSILGVSLFPILAWPSVLMLWFFLYPARSKPKAWYKRWIELSLFYVCGIIILESLGYAIVGGHLQAGRNFDGWPFVNVFHFPWWMQGTYFANGILFAALFSYVEHRRESANKKY